MYTNQRIKYLDLLRAIAIFGVIASHIFLFYPNAEVLHFKIFSFRQIFMYAVPLFLMLSGALLFKREIVIKDFLKNRIVRIIWPYIFYLVIHLCVLLLIMNFWVGGYDVAFTYFKSIPFKYNWYFWMILGLYITVPVINKFIQHSTMKELEYFIAVLFLGSIFYQIMFILDITHYVNLNLVLCPIAYLVLGYYLSHKDFKMPKNRIITISIILIIAVTLLKVLSVNGLVPFEYVTGYDITSTPRVGTRVDLGIFELIRVSSIFLIFRYLFEIKSGIYAKVKHIFENKIVVKAYTSISKSSYGMYLFHRTFLVPVEIIITSLALTGSQTCILILMLIVLTNIVAWVVILIIKRIPFINQYSGYH